MTSTSNSKAGSDVCTDERYAETSLKKTALEVNAADKNTLTQVEENDKESKVGNHNFNNNNNTNYKVFVRNYKG